MKKRSSIRKNKKQNVKKIIAEKRKIRKQEIKLNKKEKELNKKLKKLNKELTKIKKQKERLIKKKEILIKKAIKKPIKKPKIKEKIKEPTREPIKEPIRKQFLISLRHEYVDRGFINYLGIRAITLNPNVSINELKRIAAEVYFNVVNQERINTEEYEKETKIYTAKENVKIDPQEEAFLLKTGKIYVEVAINGRITDFFYF